MHTALPRLQGAACISATCSGRRSSMLQGFGTSTWLCRKFVVSRSGVNNCIFFKKKVEWGLEGYIKGYGSFSFTYATSISFSWK